MKKIFLSLSFTLLSSCNFEYKKPCNAILFKEDFRTVERTLIKVDSILYTSNFKHINNIDLEEKIINIDNSNNIDNDEFYKYLYYLKSNSITYVYKDKISNTAIFGYCSKSGDDAVYMRQIVINNEMFDIIKLYNVIISKRGNLALISPKNLPYN